MNGWDWATLIAAWLTGVCWFAPTLGRFLARNDTATPEHPAPQPTPPVAVPGPRLPPAPPAAGADWVVDERVLQRPCGCIHILDHIARKRQIIPCEIHGFDVDHWEKRYQES